jgi:DNA topoisomerase-1
MDPARGARRTGRPAVPSDAAEAVEAASLHYVTDGSPGIRRRRVGTGFTYVDPEGRPVRDLATRRRIRALAIPPAWTDVWICPGPRGHIQATGRDARGRKQYRYHPRWRAVRDGTKYSRLIAFGARLPRIRRAVRRDLGRPGLPREKVLATVVRLLETTQIRVGNAEYARANGSFGLTTLKNRHVEVTGPTITFQFRGKGGRPHQLDVNDRRVATVVRRCQELPGQELFQYVDAEGQPQRVDSADVNAYLRAVSGEDFTAKDFRTWTGTVLAARALAEVGPFGSAAEARRKTSRAIEAVAGRLGNTPAVCRKCYVHPDVTAAYQAGALPPALTRRRARRARAIPPAGLTPAEAAVLALLRARLAGGAPAGTAAKAA